MTAFVLLVLSGVVATPVWARVGRRAMRLLVAAGVAVAMACAAIARLYGEALPTGQEATAVLFGMLVAVTGGGLVVTAVFEQLDAVGDRPFLTRPPESTSTAGASSLLTTTRAVSMESAGQVLRGGAWIGALERGAVLACLLADRPEGIAVVLAVKGLGRYPELRAAAEASGGTATLSAVAERFIIGTLASFLWAALCAYVVR